MYLSTDSLPLAQYHSSGYNSHQPTELIDLEAGGWKVYIYLRQRNASSKATHVPYLSLRMDNKLRNQYQVYHSAGTPTSYAYDFVIPHA